MKIDAVTGGKAASRTTGGGKSRMGRSEIAERPGTGSVVDHGHGKGDAVSFFSFRFVFSAIRGSRKEKGTRLAFSLFASFFQQYAAPARKRGRGWLFLFSFRFFNNTQLPQGKGDAVGFFSFRFVF